jgi:hypothetical protein
MSCGSRAGIPPLYVGVAPVRQIVCLTGPRSQYCQVVPVPRYSSTLIGATPGRMRSR